MRAVVVAVGIGLLSSAALGAAHAGEWTVLASPRASGDVDDDGAGETARVVERATATGTPEVYVVVLVPHAGGPVLLGAVRLADGAVVDRVRLEPRRLTATFRQHYPIDPPCCPSRVTISSHPLVEGRSFGADDLPRRPAWRELLAALAP